MNVTPKTTSIAARVLTLQGMMIHSLPTIHCSTTATRTVVYALGVKTLNKSQVISAWAQGQPARMPNGSLTAAADGTLRSYNLIIGIRTNLGLVVGDYTASGEYHSQTT